MKVRLLSPSFESALGLRRIDNLNRISFVHENMVAYAHVNQADVDLGRGPAPKVNFRNLPGYLDNSSNTCCIVPVAVHGGTDPTQHLRLPFQAMVMAG